MDRRHFIKTSGIAALSAGLTSYWTDALAAGDVKKLSILHTNDVHSWVEPMPMDGSRNQGLGGVARRATLISGIRKQEEQVLLLDAGDIFQGTPYFNRFNGEPELKLMSAMGYDACTLGNHDFDNGLDGFYSQMKFMDFPVLCSNYDLSNTVMYQATQPYKTFKKGRLKIGVFGVGIELAGLVDKKNYGETQYLDPIQKANEMASLLRNDLTCDLVICLSHLGYRYEGNKVSDQVLAAQTRNIDLIIGGHTHTFMPHPEDVKNLDGHITTINQVGWAGINLGRIDYYFEKSGKKTRTSVTYPVRDGA